MVHHTHALSTPTHTYHVDVARLALVHVHGVNVAVHLQQVGEARGACRVAVGRRHGGGECGGCVRVRANVLSGRRREVPRTKLAAYSSWGAEAEYVVG